MSSHVIFDVLMVMFIALLIVGVVGYQSAVVCVPHQTSKIASHTAIIPPKI